LSLEVTERLKKEQLAIKNAVKEPEPKPSKTRVGLIDGIAGIQIIKNDNKEKFLGQAGAGSRKDIHSSSLDKSRPLASRGQVDTRFLTESSTISIPHGATSFSSLNQIGKPYKTMPSPTRSSVILDGPKNNNSLKEIFEECDAGSSDSNSTNNTPKPMIKSHSNATHQRRTKFHKSQTTSGSSTDGSDDDNAEKKRAAKIVDNTLNKQFSQRRDSHDDSSDSQDPGTTCSGSSNATSSLIIRNGSSSTNNKSTTQSTEKQDGHQEGRGKNISNSSDMGYRKHRTGRRRQTETRLRESQSLNRITEVQECELNNGLNTEKHEKSKEGELPNVEDLKNKLAALNQHNVKNPDTLTNATNELKANKNRNNSKAKGFSARFLNNLNFKRNHEAPQSTNGANLSLKSNRHSMEVPVMKLNSGKIPQSNRNPACPNEGSERSKKIKILGRYFQVSLTHLNCLHNSFMSNDFRFTKRSASRYLGCLNPQEEHAYHPTCTRLNRAHQFFATEFIIRTR
jgi:SNF related kinase